MAERGNCRCCGKECSINADGTVRHHQAPTPDCYAGPDSKRCKGAGQLPAGAEPESKGTGSAGVAGHICRVCHHPVQLTANDRARSHLDPRSNERCPGGSDWPLAVDERGNRTDTAPRGEVLPAVPPEGLRFGSDDPVEDFLGTGGPTVAERAAAAGDGRSAAQQAEIDRRMADPVGSALDSLGDVFKNDARNATVHPRRVETIDLPHDRRPDEDDRLHGGDDGAGGGAYQDLLGFDAQDPDGPGEEPSDGVMDVYGRGRDGEPHPDAPRPVWHRPDTRTTAYSDGSVRAGDFTDEALFDATHKVTDSSGTEWIHEGELAACRLPECCLHLEGFAWVDDDNGRSGSFCRACGSEEPAPPAPAWGTPPDLLAKMPKTVQNLVAQNPHCWTCGHPVIPLVARFGLSGNPEEIVWGCEPNCAHRKFPGSHIGEECRPRTPAQCLIAELDDGLLFVRHTKPTPLNTLVYRVQQVDARVVTAVVVSAGPYAGRTGELTNLTEEVTCTDLEGRPRPRREPMTSPDSSPEPLSPRPATATDQSSRPATPESAPSAGDPSSPETSSGPTAKATTSTRSAPMTTDAQAAADFLGAASGSHGEAEAKYGRWGRYKLRHPATGKTVEWTRATTFAKSISDTFTLSQWGKRNVLLGATMRKDIVAMAHGKDIAKDREQLNTWCEELEQAAGSKVAANLGTAVHSFTEMVDRNWPERWRLLREEIPEDFRPHVEAYILLLEEYGLEPVPHMIEFSTGVLQYEVMGTSDNCYRATKHLVLNMPRGEVRLSPGEHVIGDKKTGKDLDYGWQEICIQLALYVQGVNTQGIYNWADDTWDPDPLSRFAEPGTKVRDDIGVILHLPVDPRSTKRPALHGVDLESGWNAAVLCERVRAWRKLRTLAGPVAVVDVDPLKEDRADPLPPMHRPAPSAAAREILKGAKGVTEAEETLRATVRPPTLRERAEAVTSRSEASQVYQDALAAKVPVEEAKELIRIMQEKIAQVAEPGGAKV